jgi:DDE superfamily endonuclease
MRQRRAETLVTEEPYALIALVRICGGAGRVTTGSTRTVKNVLLVNALLVILFLSDTHSGRTHDLRIAEATPYPLPAGSGLWQDLGFLSFTLPQVAILMPTKKPRGQELPWEEQMANQALHARRLRIEHVNSSVKRCRIVKDRIRLWKAGIRDLVMELCCALHNFRVRLTPWQSMT